MKEVSPTPNVVSSQKQNEEALPINTESRSLACMRVALLFNHLQCQWANKTSEESL